MSFILCQLYPQSGCFSRTVFVTFAMLASILLAGIPSLRLFAYVTSAATFIMLLTSELRSFRDPGLVLRLRGED